MTRQNEIDLLIEQMYQAKVVYCWEYTGAGGKYTSHGIWGLSIFSGMLPFGFLWLVSDSFTIDRIEFWGVFAFMAMLVLVSRYLFFPDKHYCYQLTAMGIHYTVKDMIPDVAYTIVRGFAWLGIGVCIIAGFMLGPLAFVGAGAFALMSFGMTNFNSKINDSYVLISDNTIVFHVKNDGVISFKPKMRKGIEYVQTVYASTSEQKEELLSYLKSNFEGIETIEVKKLNEQFKHPVYKQNEFVE